MQRKQLFYFIAIVLLIMLPNIAYSFFGIDSTVHSITKRLAFFIYTLVLLFSLLTIFKPKTLFIILSPILPFSILDSYVIYISKTQSTASHYYSFFATNKGEATELISENIFFGILSIVYLSFLFYFIYKLQPTFRLSKKTKMFIGIPSLCIIVLLVIRDYKIAKNIYSAHHLKYTIEHVIIKLNKTFPLGVISKLEETRKGFQILKDFDQKNKNFSYTPVSTQNEQKSQTIVLVIGETARRMNFQIFGYHRDNTPNLSKEKNLIPFSKFTTCANNTICSVPQIITSRGPLDYKEVYNEPGLIQAFKEAGYQTYWITNQKYEIGSLFDLYSKNADTFKDVSYKLGQNNNDAVILPELQKYMNDKSSKKLFILHTAGSHFKYNLRYPTEFSKYKPELQGTSGILENSVAHKLKIINSYDNSILFTDYILHQIIQILKKDEKKSFMMYLSDHGENLYDDERNLALHGTPMPTKYELEIPMFLWHSDNYNQEITQRLRSLKNEKLSSEIVFHTLSNLGGFRTKLHKEEKDLLSDKFISGKRTFLKPDGTILYIDKTGQ